MQSTHPENTLQAPFICPLNTVHAPSKHIPNTFRVPSRHTLSTPSAASIGSPSLNKGLPPYPLPNYSISSAVSALAPVYVLADKAREARPFCFSAPFTPDAKHQPDSSWRLGTQIPPRCATFAPGFPCFQQEIVKTPLRMSPSPSPILPRLPCVLGRTESTHICCAQKC